MATNNGLGAGRSEKGPPGDLPGTQRDQPVRLSLNLSAEAMAVLRDYAERKGVSLTEAVRRAIGILKFVDETQGSGASMTVERDGRSKEIVFLA